MTTWTELTEAADDAAWPTARLDPLARVRALAAGLPGTVLHETVVDAPFDRVWGFISDLERSVPTFDRTVARLRVIDREGTRIRARSRAGWRLGRMPLDFDVDLEDGWCWMVSRPRLYVVGMAARPRDDGRTAYAHLEGVSLPGRVLQPVARASRIRTRRHVSSDVAGIERALGLR